MGNSPCMLKRRMSVRNKDLIPRNEIISNGFLSLINIWLT